MSEEEKIIENSSTADNPDISSLKSIFEEAMQSSDVMQATAVLLNLPDETFNMLAPLVLENFYQAINTPNERSVFISMLNAQGITGEEYVENMQVFIEAIDTDDSLSTNKKDFIRQVLSGTINIISETEGISKRFIQIPIEKCDPRAKFPEYAHLSDSGADVFAIEDVTIGPGETKLIHTGLKAAIPPGYELQVRPKSGRSLKSKLRVANTPGTIDAGYRDEICIIMENIEPPFKDISYDFNPDGTVKITSILHGSSYTISAGEKVAQLVLAEVPKAGFYQVINVLAVENIDENRGGGFGSTGLN